MSGRPLPRSFPKCPVACDFCRVKKVKCDGNEPCRTCINHGRHGDCYYPASNPRPRRSARERHKDLQDQLNRAEALLQAAGLNSDLNMPARNGATFDQQIAPMEMPRAENFLPNYPRSLDVPDSSMNGDLNGHHERPPLPGVAIMQNTQQYNLPGLTSRQLQSPAATVPERDQSPTQAEIHGPGSFLSICSKAGVNWVSERTGASDFSSSATSLASFVTRTLKLQTRSSKFERVQEPDAEAARKYCQVFFDECLEATCNLFHRPTVENRLNAHLANPEEIDTDPAWYALRNIIYAFGSRICINPLSPTTGWFEAQTHSWKYFQNSFSVHSDLVYCWSSVAAVQALFAMALFVEGLGAPKLEYMLVSNALRLAQSKGLFMQSLPTGNVSETEQQERSWLFWSIYIYEKHISFRSRRPSAIDDDDIDCEIPRYSPDGNRHRAETFRHIIFHAQISSAVMKELFSSKSRQKTPAVIVKTVRDLEERLQKWRQNLPSYLQPEFPIRLSNIPPGVLVEHKMWIYLNYYGTLSAIHSIFSCPWIFPGLGDEPDRIIQEQRDSSIIAAAEAARKTILATRSIAINEAAPAWLTFLFPFMGTLNLFTYILRFPSLPSVATDIDILDIGVGYFSYLAFATQSHLSVTFVKELAQWARAATTTRSISNEIRPSQIPTSSDTTSTLLNSNLPQSYDFLTGYDSGFDDWPSFFSAT